jgi:hypothetical protein
MLRLTDIVETVVGISWRNFMHVQVDNVAAYDGAVIQVIQIAGQRCKAARIPLGIPRHDHG